VTLQQRGGTYDFLPITQRRKDTLYPKPIKSPAAILRIAPDVNLPLRHYVAIFGRESKKSRRNEHFSAPAPPSYLRVVKGAPETVAATNPNFAPPTFSRRRRRRRDSRVSRPGFISAATSRPVWKSVARSGRR
jgi:hypothetical protein